ncbi:ABC transporter ATP-binding protein, partial [candidate division KSB1 bacterium]
MHNYYKEEEILGKAYDRKLMKRLLTYLKPYKFSVLAGLIFLLIASFLELLGPILVKIAIDVHIKNGNFTGLRNIAIVYVILLICGFSFSYLHNYIMEMVGQKTMYDIRKKIFSHLQNLSLSFFDRNPVGRLMTRLTNDVETLNEMFTSGVITVFNDIFILTGIIVILISFNFKLALITFSVLPLLFYATFLFRKKVRQTYRLIRLRLAKINSFLQENITGMNIVQLFNRENKNFKEFRKLNKDHMDAFLKTIFYYAVFFPSVEIISSLAIALILWYGGINVIKGSLTFGALVAFIQYAQRFYRPIQDLSEKYNIMQAAMASSERIFKLLDNREIVPESENPVELTQPPHSIEFKNVWFAYNDEDYILKNISFKVNKGEKIAIVGATGAGKTSIINLLCRFYDVSKGEICLNGIN